MLQDFRQALNENNLNKTNLYILFGKIALILYREGMLGNAEVMAVHIKQLVHLLYECRGNHFANKIIEVLNPNLNSIMANSKLMDNQLFSSTALSLLRFIQLDYIYPFYLKTRC